MKDVWIDWSRDDARYPNLQSVLYVSQREFLELALSAYQRAVADQRPPKGERWQSPEGSWSTAEGFYDALRFRLADLLEHRAVLTGHAIAQPFGGVGGLPPTPALGCDEPSPPRDFLARAATDIPPQPISAPC